MARSKHVHKYYYGLKVGSTTVWACAIPRCTHYLPDHMADAIKGRAGICWKCGEEFELTGDKKKPKPICLDCELINISSQESSLPEYKEVESIPEPKDRPLCSKCGQNPVTGASHLCMPCFING